MDEHAKQSRYQEVLDLVANLSRRVASLERQLATTQNNVERQGVEIEAAKHVASEALEQALTNEEDIRMLDERTAPKPCENKSGKTLRIHSATDTAEGISVTTTVAIDVNDGKMYVLESEVIR